MEQFLRDRGVTEDVLDRMREDKIDCSIIDDMPDEDLSCYLVSYGDRVAVRAFCKVCAAGKGKESVLSRLKDKLIHVKAGSSNRRLGNKNAKKEDKKVEVGWVHYDERSSQYHQVRSKCGGGVRHIRLLKTATISDVKKKAIELFFPGGHSKKGPILNFEVDIRDFCHEPIQDTKTITDFQEETKVKVCRLYLGTKMKDDVPLSDSSPAERENSHHAAIAEPENEVYSTDDSSLLVHLESEQNKKKRKTSASEIAYSVNELCDTNDSLPSFPSDDLLGNTEDIGAATSSSTNPSNFSDIILLQATILNSVNDEPFDDPQPGTSSSYLGLEESFLRNSGSSPDSEISFSVPAASTYTLDDTLPLVIPEQTKSQPVVVITVHRGNIMKDMIDFASDHDMDIMRSKTYEVKVINQSGIEEAAEDNGGVLGDSLTEFWETFYMQLCVGNEFKLPVLRHDMTSLLWKSVAKIIRLGWEQENIFPVKLAPPFIEQCLFGECTDISRAYMKFLPTVDKLTIEDAMKDFDSVEEDDLLDVMERHDVKCLITKNNLEKVILEVPHKEMIQAPMFIAKCWSEILKPMGITKCQLVQLYKKLEPSTRAVLKMVKYLDVLLKEEMELVQHTNNFIRELDQTMLPLFLRFCTGSDLMVKDKIAVRFIKNEQSDTLRTPTSHTCGCVLELPVSYGRDPYVVFKSDFLNILQCRYWQMDIV